jgi:DNA-directed RNA polymerase subunit RPC12/RpoP
MEKEKRHLVCQNCGYDWWTASQSDYYVTCPKCLHKVNAQKQQVVQGASKMEHFNVDENGCKILDRSIGKSGWIVDVHFTPHRAYCSYHHSSKCNHVLFALSLPEVQEIIKAKGWTIHT